MIPTDARYFVRRDGEERRAEDAKLSTESEYLSLAGMLGKRTEQTTDQFLVQR